MPHHRSHHAWSARFVIVLLAAGSVGCFAHSRGSQDWDEKPVINTGMGATILYPGQSAPTYYPGGATPAQSAQPAPAPGTPGAPPPPQNVAPQSSGSAPTYSTSNGGEQRSGSPQPGGMPITMIGGAEQDNSGHRSWKQEPLWMKYLALPFAVVAAPFKAISDSRKDSRTPGPEIPEVRPPDLGAAGPPAPEKAPVPTDYETAMVDQLERELDDRQRNAPAPRAAVAREPVRSAQRSGGGGFSIADELAALEQGPPRREAATYTTDAPARESSAPMASAPSGRTTDPAPDADGVVDRDGDGRVDQWIYRDDLGVARVELDENGDGRPDRTLEYDRESSEIARVQEDMNADGVPDSWTDYSDGRVARRRSDGNYDGAVDTWSFYDEGVITRHEQDSDGDGFRDRIGFYVGGKLVREQQDRDADGIPDAEVHYDDREQVSRREEDNDHDGLPDVVSHYESGRLSRRELLEHDVPGVTTKP